MKKFRSEALDSEGKKYAGVFEAKNEIAARQLLEAQGFKITLLESLPESEEVIEEPIEKKKKKLASSSKESKKSAGKSIITVSKKKPLRLLKYFFGGAFVLCTFPLAIWLLSPELPSSPPENTVQKYFDYEFQGKYEKQYDLLSDQSKIRSGSVESYDADRSEKKKQRYLNYSAQMAKAENSEEEVVDEKRDLDPEVLEMKRVHEHKRRTEITALVRVFDFHERHLLKVVAQNSEWKIDSVKLMSYEVIVAEPTEEAESLETTPEQKVVKLPLQKKANSPSVNGLDDIKDQAFKMLDDALRSGKINREEYKKRKIKIEQLQL